MNTNEIKTIPYIACELSQASSERTIKRLIIALVLSIIMMFANNAIWLFAWCQYDYSSEETSYTQDGEGINNINSGTQGDLLNGTKTNDKKENPKTEK